MKHPIAEALKAATLKGINLVHNGQQTRTAAYVDGKRVLVFGDAFYNEVLTLGQVAHYRGYEPFPEQFDGALLPSTAPTKPGPLARKFTRACEEVNKLRTQYVRKPSERGKKLLNAAERRAEKLKQQVTYLAA